MDTVSITRSDVPAYLRCGEFYRSLNDDEDQDQKISVPSYTLKADTTVLNNVDLHHLLSSLRFWGVSSIYDELIKYCLSELESPCDDVLQEFARDFSYVSVLISVLTANKDAKVMEAVESGIPEIVRSLPENLTVTVYCCRAAARPGNLEILQCLHERGGVLDSSVLHAALEGGDKGLACVQYLRAQGVEWPDDALVTALKTGSKECFLYALQDGCAWEEGGFGGASLCEDQYVEALKIAIQHGYPVSRFSAEAAAANGAIQCLQVLHEAGAPWDEDACKAAARNGHLEYLIYLHENGCPWGDITVYWAAYGNNIDCVQYALQQGCPIHPSCCFTAAQKGYLSILQCLHENGAPWSERTFRRTLESGQLECLKYLLENGCPIDMRGCQALMTQGKCSQEAVELVKSFHPDLM